MSIVQSTPLQRQTIRLPRSISNLCYYPLTEWMPCSGIDTVQAYLSNRAATPAGAIEQYLAWQYAAVRPERPGLWTTGGTDIGSGLDGVRSATVTSSTQFWIRFGVALRATGTPTTEETVEVDSSFTWTSRGRVVGQATLDLDPPGVSFVNFLPVSGWIPAIEAEKVRAAMVLTSWTTDLDYRLAVRTAQNVESPGAWIPLEAGWPNPSAVNTERCTGDITLTTYTVAQQYVQFAIGIMGANGQGDLNTWIAVSRS